MVLSYPASVIIVSGDEMDVLAKMVLLRLVPVGTCVQISTGCTCSVCRHMPVGAGRLAQTGTRVLVCAGFFPVQTSTHVPVRASLHKPVLVGAYFIFAGVSGRDSPAEPRSGVNVTTLMSGVVL
jgi:hypothetical protein